MKEKNNPEGKRVKNDIIFITLLLVAAAVGMFYLFVLREGGDTVRVTVDGELFGVYPLSENIAEDIHTDGEGLNRLVIEDGKAKIVSATCPDGICVAHSPIYRNGESIVCLPNKVVVTVVTEKDTDTPDVIA